MECHRLSTGKNRKKSNKSLFLGKSMIESHLLVGMTNAIFLSRIFFSCMLVKANKCSKHKTRQSRISLEQNQNYKQTAPIQKTCHWQLFCILRHKKVSRKYDSSYFPTPPPQNLSEGCCGG